MCVLLWIPSLLLFSFLGQTQPYTKHRIANSLLTMSSATSMSDKPRQRIQWRIRPATPDDSISCGKLLYDSYSLLLAPDYTDECLQKCLPFFTTPRPDLLTCPTWYVVEHLATPGLLVGCGGWTATKPTLSSSTTDDVNDQKESTTQQENSDHLNPQPVVIPHLRHFAVHPDYARQGIATLLWQKCVQDITKATTGTTFPTMEVYSTITAQPFYKSCGFIPFETTAVQLGPDDALFPCILMRREAV